MLTQMRNKVYLIFHQCDEWRDNNGHTIHEQRRQLIAQRLTTACRHQHKSVMSIQHIANDCLLIAFEHIKTKIATEGFIQIYMSYLPKATLFSSCSFA